MKHSLKGKTVIQYKENPSFSLEKEEKEMERQKVIEDIEDLEFAIQNIIDQYSENNEIKQDFKIIEKQISLLYNKYNGI